MMNERIKQLIEQATIRSEEYLPGNDGHPTPTVYFDKEKFAELIVRECASEAHRRVCIDGNDNMIYANLLAHFGVEE